MPVRTKSVGYHSLPFAAPNGMPRKNGHRDWWWNVKPTKNWGADNQRGELYARLFLDYASKSDSGSVLGMIADSMAGEASGVTVGFWTYIELAAAHGRKHADDVHEYWRRELVKRGAP